MTTYWLMPIRELARFFIWWGFTVPKQLLKLGWDIFTITDDNLRLATNLKLWLAFEPLFGEYDWRGHLIGFFLRGMRTAATAVIYVGMLILTVALPLVWYALIAAVLVMIF